MEGFKTWVRFLSFDWAWEMTNMTLARYSDRAVRQLVVTSNGPAASRERTSNLHQSFFQLSFGQSDGVVALLY